MRSATSVGASIAMMALLGGLPRTLHAQNGGWAPPRGEQDFLQNRFPELKGLTNSAEDQKKALDLCGKYRVSNQAISMAVVRCNAAAHVYMSEGQKAVNAEEQKQANLQQQQAADRQHQQAVAIEQQQAAAIQQRVVDRQQKVKEKAIVEKCEETAAFKRSLDASDILRLGPSNAQLNGEIQRLQQVHPTTASDSDQINNRISTDRDQIEMNSNLLKKSTAEYQSLGGDPGSQAQLSKDNEENPCAQLAGYGSD